MATIPACRRRARRKFFITMPVTAPIERRDRSSPRADDFIPRDALAGDDSQFRPCYGDAWQLLLQDFDGTFLERCADDRIACRGQLIDARLHVLVVPAHRAPVASPPDRSPVAASDGVGHDRVEPRDQTHLVCAVLMASRDCRAGGVRAFTLYGPVPTICVTLPAASKDDGASTMVLKSTR